MNRAFSQIACPSCLKALETSAVNCINCGLSCHKTCAEKRIHVVTPGYVLRTYASDLPVGGIDDDFSADAKPPKKSSEKSKKIHERNNEQESEKKNEYWICNRCIQDEQLLKKFDGRIESIVDHQLHANVYGPKEQMRELKNSLKEYEREIAHFRRDARRQPKAKLIYGILITAILALTAAIVWLGWAQKPEITIQYDVGTIVGGILVGAGATIAGTAYALSRRE